MEENPVVAGAVGTQTGGIRLHKEDGAALWAFGATETRVRVVE